MGVIAETYASTKGIFSHANIEKEPDEINFIIPEGK